MTGANIKFKRPCRFGWSKTFFLSHSCSTKLGQLSSLAPHCSADTQVWLQACSQKFLCHYPASDALYCNIQDAFARTCRIPESGANWRSSTSCRKTSASAPKESQKLQSVERQTSFLRSNCEPVRFSTVSLCDPCLWLEWVLCSEH